MTPDEQLIVRVGARTGTLGATRAQCKLIDTFNVTC